MAMRRQRCEDLELESELTDSSLGVQWYRVLWEGHIRFFLLLQKFNFPFHGKVLKSSVLQVHGLCSFVMVL